MEKFIKRKNGSRDPFINMDLIISLGINEGTNNWVELTTLAALLKLAIERNVRSLQVFGDSKLQSNCRLAQWKNYNRRYRSSSSDRSNYNCEEKLHYGFFHSYFVGTQFQS
jgi:ribonuclease HI